MNNDERTMRFDANKNESNKVSNMLNTVYNALEEKEYNPINQIVGYLLSGDPAYIPRHNDARNLIRRFERDEVLEEILKEYLERNEK
ncbi:MAG TPA: IreB family regulatory phosphoprotein [Atopostipes sp.]|nr:IreB family regulatory phosphoprotein [Atopostipes sp.]